MIEISGSARYDVPVGTIFAIITDPARYPAWQPDVEWASLAGDGPIRQGACIHQVRTVMGRRTELGLTFTQLVPADLVTLATDSGATPAVRQTYRLRPDGDGCGLDYRLTLDGVPTMAEPLARSQLTRQTQQMLERLATAAATERAWPTVDASPPHRRRQPFGTETHKKRGL
jgi:Polyketide cyclase / dehydrase and lipid transport